MRGFFGLSALVLVGAAGGLVVRGEDVARMRDQLSALVVSVSQAPAFAALAHGAERKHDAPRRVPHPEPGAPREEAPRAPRDDVATVLARVAPNPRVLPPKDVASEPAPPPVEPAAETEEPRIVSTGKVTTIYARPSKRARRLGYLRAGAVVSRADEPTTRRGCAGGFYEIAPEGFVCVGSTASTDVEHVMARVASRRADRNAALPYTYGIAPHGGGPLYTRIPDEAEQRRAEPDFDWHARHPSGKGFREMAPSPIPWFLENGEPTISAHGYRMPRAQLVERRALPRSGYAFVTVFESGGRRFGLTTEMAIIPVDRVDRVFPSRFHGIPLDRGLPVVFARGRKVPLYAGEPTGPGLHFERMLDYREALAVTGRTARVGKRKYLETRDGGWVLDSNLVMLGPPSEMPDTARDGAKWIDVSIERQTLVAYVGERPVFATLVSTGRDGTDDPETTHATVQGQFRIHTKHVSVTMDGDQVGDEFELGDVPYVQYFTQGYALHAAYWHDGFGAPRSHGCVNLSPHDARWLFGWTDPPVPTAWHGAMSVARGTLVSIHP